MKRFLVAFFASAIAVIWPALIAAEKPDSEPEPTASSLPVSLGEGDYQIVGLPKGKLELRHVYRGVQKKWRIVPELNKLPPHNKPAPDRRDGKAEWTKWFGPETQISEVALARQGPGLIGLVKTTSANESVYWALNVFNDEKKLRNEPDLGVFTSFMAIADAKDEIIAFYPAYRARVATVIVGRFEKSLGYHVESARITIYRGMGTLSYSETGAFAPVYPGDEKAGGKPASSKAE